MASEAVERGALEGAGGAVVGAGVGVDVDPTHKQTCVVGGGDPHEAYIYIYIYVCIYIYINACIYIR